MPHIPRNIVKSYSNHNQISLDRATEFIKEVRTIGGIKSSTDRTNETITHVGSWSSNYTSWKEFKKVDRYLLIKYEDLVKETEKTFLNVLNFINKITKSKLALDQIKLKKTLITTRFDNLQNLEKNSHFAEQAKDKEGKSVNFFKYGPNNNWKDYLSSKNLNVLENSFKEEMTELEYL